MPGDDMTVRPADNEEPAVRLLLYRDENVLEDPQRRTGDGPVFVRHNTPAPQLRPAFLGVGYAAATITVKNPGFGTGNSSPPG